MSEESLLRQAVALIDRAERALEQGGGDDARAAREVLSRKLLESLRSGAPSSADEYATWKKTVAALRRIDPATYASEPVRRLLRGMLLMQLDRVTHALPTEAPPAPAFTELDLFFEAQRSLSFLLAQETDQPLRSLCIDRLATTERQTLRVCGGRLDEHVRRQVRRLDPPASAIGRVDQSLVDALEPVLRRKAESVPLAFVRSGDDGGHYVYEHVVPGGRTTRWTIAHDPFSYAQLQGIERASERQKAEEKAIVCMRSVDNPEMLVALEQKDFLAAVERDWLPDLIRTAVAHHESEEKGAKALQAFDLPKDRPVEELRVYPREYDDMMATTLGSSAIVSTALARRYPKMTSHPPLFTDDPKASLMAFIREKHADGKGTSHFLFHLYNHGDRDRMLYGKPLRGEDLVEIKRAFPGCDITFTSIACYGGGIMEGARAQLRDDPRSAEGFSLFLQTKPTIENLVYANGTPGAIGYLRFASALLDRDVPTFGAAWRVMDKGVKRSYSMDAEAFIRGTYVAERRVEPPEMVPT